MGRRRSKARKNRPGAAPAPAAGRPELIPWRVTMEDLAERLRAWSQEHYGPALRAYLAERWADADPVEHAEDLRQAADDCICAPGSAGDGTSILAVFCDQARGVERTDLDQLRRWEQERRRGVFVVQRHRRDRLFLWDPLEGAPITLHLLEKLPPAKARRLGPATVVTAVYQPWLARLVAVGVEFFADPRALQLFREQTAASGTPWHEPPAPAPEKSRGTSARA